MCQIHFIENYYNMKKSLFVVLSVLLIAVSSCGPRSHADRTRDLLVSYFDSLALDLEIVSLQAVDTIYTEMPEDDSTYLAFIGERDAFSDQALLALQEGRKEDFDSLCRKSDEYLVKAKVYQKEYKGALIGYAYEIIVRCDNYDLKSTTENMWYVVNAEGTSFFVAVKDFQEVARMEKATQELDMLLRRVRGL